MNTTPTKTDAKKQPTIVVCIDAGHGINTPGKCSPNKSLREWKWNREVAAMVHTQLKEQGIDARLVVTEDQDISLTERCRRINYICNQKGKKNVVSVSVHVNAAGSDGKWHEARGWAVFVAPEASQNSKDLAGMLYDVAIGKGLQCRKPMPNQKYWTKSLAMVKKTVCPAVLVENFFQDNKADCEWLLTDEGKTTCASVMVEGILKYINR